MSRIREAVDIRAPPAAVWKAAHVDLAAVPRWSPEVERAEVLGGGPPAAGARLLYRIGLPGGRRESLTLRVETWDPPRRCAGDFAEGPLKGTWSYTYSEKGGVTRLDYEVDYQLGGLLRFAGGALRGGYESAVKRTLAALKEHVEGSRRAPARRRPPPGG